MILRTKRRPGFSLLELLIATTAFVTVAIVSTAILTSAMQRQGAQQRSQRIAAQMDAAIGQIEKDIRESVRASDVSGLYSYGLQVLPLKAAQSLDNYPQNAMLIATIPLRNESGGALGNLTHLSDSAYYVKHVYCAEPQADPTGQKAGAAGERLVRFTVAPADASIDWAGVPTLTCDQAGIAALFAGQAVTQTKDYLTEPETELTSLRFWPVWPTLPGPQGAQRYNADPPAVRLEMAARYNVANASSTALQRVQDDATNTPLVARLLVDRLLPYASPSITSF